MFTQFKIDLIWAALIVCVCVGWGGGIASGAAPPDNFEKNKDGKIVHSDAFLNDILELQRQF